jgi:hypothetical protein
VQNEPTPIREAFGGDALATNFADRVNRRVGDSAPMARNSCS